MTALAMAVALGQKQQAMPRIKPPIVRPAPPPVYPRPSSPGTYVIRPPEGDLPDIAPPPGGTRAQAINPAAWVTFNDYPADMVRIGAEGRAFYRVRVQPNGRPNSCAIFRSSGHASLDARTCVVVLARARFQPARDARRRAVAGDYVGIIRWQMPS